MRLRSVVSAVVVEGRGSVLGPDTDRRVRWYEIELECGHVVERLVRYRPHPSGLRQRQRDKAAAIPPPARARCEFCREVTA